MAPKRTTRPFSAVSRFFDLRDKNYLPKLAAFLTPMRLPRLPINSPIIFTCVALGLSAVGGDRSLHGQNDTSSPVSQFPIGTGTHVSKAEFQGPIGLANPSEIPGPDNIEMPAPTRSSF